MVQQSRNPDWETLDYSDDLSIDGSPHRNVPSRAPRFARPLIDYVRNEWQSNPQYSQLPTATTTPTESSRLVQIVQSIITAPRFRRYVVVYIGLILSCWIGWHFVLSPRLEEQAALLSSLDPQTKEVMGGWFGANDLPHFDDIVQLRTLDPALLPAPTTSEPNQRRLVVVGDVHGCKDELERLLQEVSFNQDHDHLILAGDLINKGPDSPGVVDLAKQFSASCVRGNHEDRVLLLRHEMAASNTLNSSSLDEAADTREHQLARQLNDDQAKWLDDCPVILDVGVITDMGRVAVVHGGLVPGVPLDKQDPYSVMTMLTIDLNNHVPSSSRKGTKWTKLFNEYQSLIASSQKNTASDKVADADLGATTVIYGHDSKTGLSLKTYTKGLDSGCVKGGKLTALIIKDGGKHETVQVKCSKHKKT